MITLSHAKPQKGNLGPSLLPSIFILLFCSALLAQSNDDCMMCHEDPDLSGTVKGKEKSVFVDSKSLASGVHAAFSCTDCHVDLSGTELPHEEALEPVDCGICHDDMAAALSEGSHAGWLEGEITTPACLECHGYHGIQARNSPTSATHASQLTSLCANCHGDVQHDFMKGAHAPQDPSLPEVTCGSCHDVHRVQSPKGNRPEMQVCGQCHGMEARHHGRSRHGQAADKGDALAPHCTTCHGAHDIHLRSDPNSTIAPMNIPMLCGTCHHEGTEVSINHDIPQERILENYSQSIHGEGLFKRGLTVTAVCTSCHEAHDTLDHSDPRSSIHPDNVAGTCMKCHARIEEVHVKVIEGELWEKEPHKIPSCSDCHPPHKIRRRPTQIHGAANADCMKCHSNPSLTMERDGQQVSLFVDEAAFARGSHSDTACAKCHTEVKITLERPCSTINSPVDCSICHAEVVEAHQASTHGMLAAAGDPDAPQCLDCHDKHDTESHRIPSSPTFSRNVPELCGKCHGAGGVAAGRAKPGIPDSVDSYANSIHGQGLLESGLVVSATCTDCHGSHKALPAENPESSVHPDRVAHTCGTCHDGIEEIYVKSVHWPKEGKSHESLPTCEDCHTSHSITRTDNADFRFMMMDQCGRCHHDQAETFFDTFHGKVSRLGSSGAAKCYDCHGTHDILPSDDPDSALSHKNVVETCAKCHKGAHRQFAGYLTHATHHDPQKYPFLYYSFWFMTTLLVGTLSFFILHTLAWLWRLWRTREQWRPHKHVPAKKYYRRFSRTQRAMHLIMLCSFFALALTGMALKFSYMSWALVISNLLGGFESMATLHRIGAVTLLILFTFHIGHVFVLKSRSGLSWWKFIFGPNSMMFNLGDVKQAWQSVKWFLGRGPRPHYGRFTYWEKFDYFAVFWGVFVIGSTGMVLWFPEFFTLLLPGWSVNVATIIHSDEALLAVGFIFTIHFFNTHFRPDKFPMDPVIFTGRVSLNELKHDKPAEYEALVQGRSDEEIEAQLVDPFPKEGETGFRVFGFAALAVGLSLIILILYAMLFGYR